MEIGIAGLGSSGSYLAKRLENAGFRVQSFDPKRSDYYIPCGYAANLHRMKDLLKKIGMRFDDYILSEAMEITFAGEGIEEFAFNSLGLCTFDKNGLERDIVRDLEYEQSTLIGDFDIIIDATGVSRSILGKVESDFTMYTREYVSDTADHEDFYFRYFSRGKGYFWEFPLSDLYHVGVGTSDYSLMEENLRKYRPVRITGRKIRLKPLFDQMTKGKVIGVGESIGTVSPITGEGIVPSMECAELLFESLKKYSNLEDIKENYEISVRKRFSDYQRLFGLLTNFRSGSRMSLSNLRAVGSVTRSMKEFGIDFRLSGVIRHFI